MTDFEVEVTCEKHPFFDIYDYDDSSWQCVQCGAFWDVAWGDPVDCARWLIAEARWWAERADSFAGVNDPRRRPYPMLPWLAAGYGHSSDNHSLPRNLRGGEHRADGRKRG